MDGYVSDWPPYALTLPSRRVVQDVEANRAKVQENRYKSIGSIVKWALIGERMGRCSVWLEQVDGVDKDC